LKKVKLNLFWKSIYIFVNEVNNPKDDYTSFAFNLEL